MTRRNPSKFSEFMRRHRCVRTAANVVIVTAVVIFGAADVWLSDIMFYRKLWRTKWVKTPGLLWGRRWSRAPETVRLLPGEEDWRPKC